MKQLSVTGLAISLFSLSLFSCKKEFASEEAFTPANEIKLSKLRALPHTKQFSSEVATQWFDLQTDLTRTTPGFGPGIAGRAFAYSGMALYESVVPGMPSYQSMFEVLTGFRFPADKKKDYYWPASANAAMAQITRKFFVATSPANMASINQLEASHLAVYQNDAPADQLAMSVAFGKLVADSIFEWSKRDGGLPPYPTYTPSMPAPGGQWVPTFPGFAPGTAYTWGENRSFIPNVANTTQPSPPIAYSTDVSSPFFKMVQEVYNISTRLTADDITLVRTWAELPGNYVGQAHLTRVLSQLVREEKLDLERAALAFAHHGIAVNDVAISCFKAKYHYKLVRPITYIRTIMNQPTWTTVIATPPHPEYPAAHAAISGASATILKSFFGADHSFTDHAHDNLHGPRTYSSITAYEEASGWSRVLAGVHYIPSVDAGLKQGRDVGSLVLQLPFKKE